MLSNVINQFLTIAVFNRDSIIIEFFLVYFPVLLYSRCFERIKKEEKRLVTAARNLCVNYN